MTVAVACALLVGAAVYLETRPAPVPARIGPDLEASIGGDVRARPRRRGPSLRRPRRRREGVPDVAGLMSEVAARLRAGAPVAVAWERTLGRATAASTPAVAATPDELLTRWASAIPAGRGARAELAVQIRAVQAATHLADRLGAPLADVLDRCSLGVAAAGRAEAARRVALAGPTSTARLLTALPVIGLFLGVALGADPVAALLDGGPGTAAGVLGLALLVAGHRWTSALVRTAREAGSGGPDR